MWSRVAETMLGLWLIVSVFIFPHPEEKWSWWATDLASGLLVIVLALLSYVPALKRAHLGILLVALWLLGFGFLAAPYPTPPALQNDIVLALLLGMLAIIPSEATRPPDGWLEMEEELNDEPP